MISIVVVSHSRALADSAVALASQMAGPQPPRIAVAAGLDDEGLGTDATAIAAALEEVDSPDGTLVLLDLGSALLSAGMALDFVDPEVASRVRLSAAPLVEGLVAAVVTASTGAGLDAVEAEAVAALVAKQEHLAESAGAELPVPEAPTADAQPQVPAGTGARASEPVQDHAVVTTAAAAEDAPRDTGPEVPELHVELRNPHGLHARPAAALVAALAGIDATVHLWRGDRPGKVVDSGSITAVQGLGIGAGQELVAAFAGPSAAEARRRLERLAARNFGDDLPATPLAPAASGGTLSADLPTSRLQTTVELSGYQPGDDEAGRLAQAMADVDTFLGLLAGPAHCVEQQVQPHVLAALRAMLDDPSLAKGMRRELALGVAAPQAVQTVLGAAQRSFEALDNPYLRERATDLRCLERLVLLRLAGQDLPLPQLPVGHVVELDELDAVVAAQLDPQVTPGVRVRAAASTGHGVIVARARGIAVSTGQPL